MSLADVAAPVFQGEPDGPVVFVASLGLEVPTFIDERLDLVPDSRTAGVFKRLKYHVPVKKRGSYKADWLPEEYARHLYEAGEIRTNMAGEVMCSSTSVLSGGKPCGNKAVNRSNVCRNHGGALHPADKKLTGLATPGTMASVAIANPEKYENLDRAQKFMSGMLGVEELSDDELTGGYVLNDDGRPISNRRASNRFQQEMVKELHKRMNQFMQMKLPHMLKRVTDIAMSDVAEPETALKAAIWAAERQIGRTPEVLIHAQTGAPYETIFDSMEGGSREDYRKSIASVRGTGQIEGTEYAEEVDISDVDDGEADPEVQEDDFNAYSVRLREDDLDSRQYENESGQGESVRSRILDGSESKRDAHSRAAELQEKATKAQRIIDERKKAQRRRFAARASGATSLSEIPWLIEWKPNKVMRSGKYVVEGWRGSLVCPDDQTEQKLAKMARQS